IRTGSDSVRVVIVVNQGAPVRIGAAGGPLAVELAGLETIEDTRVTAAIIAASPEPGDVLDEDAYEEAKRRMRHLLADAGYAFARVSGRSEVDLSRHEARLRFEIEAGPRARFGAVTIAGLESIPEDVVRQNLSIAPGDEYSAAAVEDARRSLVNLGVFAAVNVDVDTSDPGSR